MKNRKAGRQIGLNTELFQYGVPFLSNRLLKFLNKFWRERPIPEVMIARITEVSVL